MKSKRIMQIKRDKNKEQMRIIKRHTRKREEEEKQERQKKRRQREKIYRERNENKNVSMRGYKRDDRSD